MDRDTVSLIFHPDLRLSILRETSKRAFEIRSSLGYENLDSIHRHYDTNRALFMTVWDFSLGNFLRNAFLSSLCMFFLRHLLPWLLFSLSHYRLPNRPKLFFESKSHPRQVVE
jgi:hypothetical protein